MYGWVKMRDGERVCNLSVMVVQSGHRVVDIATYYTEADRLEVDNGALNSIVWPGSYPDHMPVRDTARTISTLDYRRRSSQFP